MARDLGWETLEAVFHGDLSDEDARLRYIYLNLNRCGQYGHYHVKIRRVFEDVMKQDKSVELTPDAASKYVGRKVDLLHNLVSWPEDKVRDYVELSEHDKAWRYFANKEPDEGFYAYFDRVANANANRDMFERGSVSTKYLTTNRRPCKPKGPEPQEAAE